MVGAVEVIGAPHVRAGLVEQGQGFLGVLARDFEAVLKNDEGIKELLKKKAMKGKSWTIVLRAGFYQNNNSLDAVLHIQHIFSTDETEWAYLLHAFNVRGAVVIDEPGRELLRNFKNSERKSEHIADIVSFNIRVLSLFKNLLRELSALDWADGEGRSKVKLRIVLSNQAELVKVQSQEVGALMSTTSISYTPHSFKSKYTLSLEDIYRLALAGWTREEITEEFGVRPEFISLLVQFVNISPDEEYSVLSRTRGRGRLSEEMKKKIQELLLKGHSNYYISRELGVSLFDVNKVMREVYPDLGRW